MKNLSNIAGVCCVLMLGLVAVAEEAVLPPDAEGAPALLKDSPRHGEFVYIPLADTDTKLKTFVVYPERAEKAPVVLVIHEIYGMTDWSNSVADAFAREGFIAVAPDLVSGMEGAEDNPREAIGKLTPEETVKRLNAALEYGLALPAASGKVGCVGYCYGGRTTFFYASEQPKLDAAVVFYGSSPDKDALAKINAPIQGHYGGKDNRVNSTIPDAEATMKKLQKPFEVNIYEGAGHGFLRQQDGQDGANLKAGQQAWPKTIAFLKAKLEAK